MSKETLNAEEFVLRDDIPNLNGMMIHPLHLPIVFEVMEKYADYKFKAKVNAITDEEIDKHFGMGGEQKEQLQRLKSYKQGLNAIKWFKSILLNGK